MGYVFDAMNRNNDDDQHPDKAQRPSDAPITPPDETVDESVGEVVDESAPINPPTADQSEPVDEPVEPQTVSHTDSPVDEPAELQTVASDLFPDDQPVETQQPEAADDAVVEIPTFDFTKAQQEQEEDYTDPVDNASFDPPVLPHTTQDAQAAPPLRLTSEWLSNIDDRLVSLTEPSSQLAEEYRGIRTSTLARWDHRRHLVHTITSATPQEGKTITSLNLGMSLAELRNRKTIVLEADLRLPTFNKLLHLDESKGMIGYLRGEAELDEVIQTIEGSDLHIITAGSRASNDAVQLLSNHRMAKMLDELRTRYDHVIIDTPPVIELADAGILGGLSDEVMLIVRISRTPKPLIEQALRALRSYNAPVAGVIATDQERGRNRYHYYRYGYRYRYRYYAKRAA